MHAPDHSNDADRTTVENPAAVADRPGVEYLERSETHQHHFDVYDPVAGMAVVGAVDEGRLLLLVNEDAGHAMLPHDRVDPGGDFAAVARASVRERTGVAVSDLEPVRVRYKTYRSEDGDETTGHDVVFHASPATPDADPAGPHVESDDEWTVGWYDELPVDPADGDGDVLADVRAFIDDQASPTTRRYRRPTAPATDTTRHMSEHEPQTADATESTADVSLTDPAVLADREDVDYREHTFVHESEDHCEREFVGRAIVGVTDDRGRLLLRIHEESGGGMLPNGKVEAGSDWATEAVRGVREQTGLDVELDGPKRLRLAEHRVEDEETPFEATTHVVFGASSVDEDAEPHTDVDGVSVEWCDSVPDANGDRPATDDIRSFLD